MSSRQVIATGNGRMKLNLDSVVRFSPPLTSKNCERDAENIPYSQPQSTEPKHFSNPLSPSLPQKQSSSKFQNHQSLTATQSAAFGTSPPSYKYDFPRQPSIEKCSPLSRNAYVNLPENGEIKEQNAKPPAHTFVVPRQLYINEKPVSYDVPKMRGSTIISKNASRGSPPQKITLHHVPDLSKVYVDVNYQVVVSPEPTPSNAKSPATNPLKPRDIAESLQYLDVVDSKRIKSCHRSYQTLPHPHKTKPGAATNKGENRAGLSLYDNGPSHGGENLDILDRQAPHLTSLGQEEDIMERLAQSSVFKNTPHTPGKMEGGKGKEKGENSRTSCSLITKMLKRFTPHQRDTGAQTNPDFSKNEIPTFRQVPTSCCLLTRFTRRRSKKESSLHPCPRHCLKRVDSGKRTPKFNVRTKVALPSFAHFAKKNKVKRSSEKEISSATPRSTNDGIIKKIMGRLSYHEIDLEKTEALRKMMSLSNID